MNNFFLEKLVNQKLKNIGKNNDYCPNGLQIEGKSEISKIITGVTASQRLLIKAIKKKADAIIVHHGYFWKNSSKRIIGMHRNRCKLILQNDINLFTWHLPLDIDSELGNNVLLGKALNIIINGNVTPYVMYGQVKYKITAKNFLSIIKKKLNRTPFHYGRTGPKYIKKLAWCTGKGQNYIYKVLNYNVDAYLTGEVSEETIHIAEENNMHFFSLGHHATEKFGIYSLGKWLSKKDKNLDITFIDINNPI